MIFLVGDSHVNALRLGAQSLAERGELPQTDLRIGMLGNGKHALNEFSEVRDGRVVLTQADYAASLKRLTGDSHFLPADEASYAICLGFHSAPIFRHPLWRRYRPADLVTSPPHTATGLIGCAHRDGGSLQPLHLPALREAG